MTLIAVHDATSITLDYGLIEPVCDWLRAHDLDPANIYRFEIHGPDAPSIRVFEYLRDGSGHRISDGRKRTKRDPYDVPMRVDPPAGLGTGQIAQASGTVVMTDDELAERDAAIRQQVRAEVADEIEAYALKLRDAAVDRVMNDDPGRQAAARRYATVMYVAQALRNSADLNVLAER
jgi:hypothetical protein